MEELEERNSTQYATVDTWYRGDNSPPCLEKSR
jgi:hypothetical protein